MFVAVAFLLSRFTKDLVGRSLLAFVLFGAAFTYVLFAAQAGEGGYWVAGELVGVGWAAHPVWDVALHYFGPGGSFAPDAYAITCLSFDLLVAAYVVIAYGLVARRAPVLRQGAH
jgi:hypothetical protein